ncbi:hypothetical protein IAE51_11015 [Lactococcus sp. S64]|uniref:hypothetical protein n=1 Tax=Lactococcus sp. S64 TaxID=2767459 RepID=UPI00190561A1|nr:hypothetical protein [Lactococcus sp. S64]MBK0084423.1 hypothetical protein [Lactococcus sp. S64]
MLTDRQNKFLTRMIELNKENSSATYKERVYLKRSIEAIQFDTKFQDGINALNLSLKGLTERDKELSPDVLKLNKDLIEVYGEPGYKVASHVNKDNGMYHNFGPW